MALAADPATLLAAALAVAAASVYLYYYSSQANQPDIHPLQLAQQSSVASIRESPNESPVYRAKTAPAGTQLLATPPSGLASLTDALRAAARSPHRRRPDAVQYVAAEKVARVSSDEMAARASGLAAGLIRFSARSSPVAILLPASPEFLVAYRACLDTGIVAIPISAATTPPASIHAILRHSCASVLVTSAELAMTLADFVTATSLTHLVLTGELDGSAPAEALRSAATVVSMAELERCEPPEEDSVVAPADPAYVLYSPGDASAAPPRGVVITHANAMAAIAGLLSNLPASQAITATDVFLSTASMANAANLNFINIALIHGCSICALETADAEAFATYAYSFRPTFVYLEPLISRDLVQLFYSHIAKYPQLEYNIFMAGYRRVVDSLMRGMTPKWSFWDFTYFRHYRNVIGGNLRLMFIDGPATPSKSIEWLRALHGARVIPLFGSDQTTAVVTAGAFYDYASAIDTHNVGAPLACNEIKIVDSDASVGLTANDKPYPRGTIAVRGPNVATRLWNSEKPVELSDDGWLELPFYGELLPNGTIDVIGTRQTVTKSALSPTGLLLVERLERALSSSRAVTDLCVVVPDPSSKSIGIVAHPRPMELFAAAKRLKKEYKMKQIDNYPWCADYIREKLVQTAKDNHYEWLADVPLENIKVKLVSEPFSVANGMAKPDGSNNRESAKKLI
ncbi:medium-chain fatty acid-CoA ligase faa2 [Coemansia sp. RSA 2050]|nr:medium-chain fatty acid-CoA ligase faa2 [Coemansia sp. RSA 2050]KAJ2730024.1 medium-chain fatty acid-CoA ligase faa2 [Coemansia sp. BCRC 34962]